MDTIELRIMVNEEVIQELLWHALTPDAIVITRALNEAIEQQRDLRGVSLDGYQPSGVSVTFEADAVYAELTYTRAAGTARND